MLQAERTPLPAAPGRPRRRPTPKPLLRSRLWLSLLLLTVGAAINALLPELPPELLDVTTRLLVDEIVRYAAPGLAGLALVLNTQDRRNAGTPKPTAGDLARVHELAERVAKAERQRSQRGVATVELLAEVVGVVLMVLVFAAMMGLSGCARQYKHCEFDLLDHPTKPAPAARYEQRCDGGREYFDVDDLSTADKRRCP